jgi:hypothetical protein
MLFLDDLDAFLSGLSINDTSQLHLFLLNAAGEVVWQASGDYSDASGNALRAAAEALE